MKHPKSQFAEVIKNAPLGTHYDYKKNVVNKCSKIADSMTIDFANWLNSNFWSCHNYKKHTWYQGFDNANVKTTEELLFQFKTEFYKK